MQTWSAPDGTALGLELAGLHELDTRAGWTFDAEVAGAARLRLTGGAGPRTIRPRERVALPGGALELVSIRPWIGYAVERTPLVPWMLASSLLGLAGLGWHYVGRRLRMPSGASNWEVAGEHG